VKAGALLNPMTIPPIILVIGALWNLIAWIWFGLRYKLHPVIFLSIPFAILAGIYVWFTFVDVSPDMRAEWVRGGLFLVVYSQAPVLTLLALVKRKG